MTADSTYRIASSYLFAAGSIVFVMMEDHVHVDLLDPSTYGSILEHRCGIAMLIACIWALAETAYFFLFAEESSYGIGSTSSASFLQ